MAPALKFPRARSLVGVRERIEALIKRFGWEALTAELERRGFELKAKDGIRSYAEEFNDPGPHP